MEYDKAKYAIVSKLIDFNSEPLLFIKDIDLINKGKKSERVFVGTLNGGYFYKHAMFSKKLELDFLFLWDSIKKLTSSNEKCVLFNLVDKEFSVQSNDVIDICQVICSLMSTIFLSSHLPIVKLTKPVSKNNPFDEDPIVLRFMFLCRKHNKKPSTEIIDSLTEHMKENRKNISKGKNFSYDISVLSDFEDYCDDLYGAIEIDDNKKAITIPFTQNHDSWKGVSKLLQKSRTIFSILIKEELNEGFHSIIDALNRNSKSKLVTISFIDTVIKPEFISLVGEFVNSYPVKSLNFIRCLDEESSSRLFELISETPIFGNIKFLTISHCIGSNPSALIKHMKSLIYIDFSYNDVDIAVFFKELSKNKRSKLREIVCSGNYCSIPLPEALSLPKKLNNLNCSDTHWHDSSLLSLMKVLSRNNPLLGEMISVDLSRANLEMSIWMDFFTNVSNYPVSKIVLFNFSFNPLMEGLFNFLLECPNLISLYLEGCLQENEETMDCFLDFIQDNNSVRKLWISGSEKFKIKSDFERISNILSKKKLSVLDIQNNDIGDVLFPSLTDFLSSNYCLIDLYIENNNFTDIGALEDFLKFLDSRHTRLSIQIPKNDLSNVKKNNKKLSVSEATSIMNMIQAINKFPKSKEQIHKKSITNENDLNRNQEEFESKAPPEIQTSNKRADLFSEDGDEEVCPYDENEDHNRTEEEEQPEPEQISNSSNPPPTPEPIVEEDIINEIEENNTPSLEQTIIDENDFLDDSHWFNCINNIPFPIHDTIIEDCRKDFAIPQLISNMKKSSV